MLGLSLIALLTALDPAWQAQVLSDAPTARARALAHLRELGKPGLYALQDLVQKSEDPNLRARAVRALGELGMAEAEWQLRAELKQPSAHVVAAAVRAVQALKLFGLANGMVERVGDPDPELCVALGAAASAFPSIVERAEKEFESTDPQKELGALRVLSAAGQKPAEAKVRGLAAFGTGELQLAAAQALSGIDGDAAARALGPLTEGPFATEAIVALGQLGNAAALATLEQLLSSPRYRAAAAALASSTAGEKRLVRRRASASVSAQDAEVIDGLLEVESKTPEVLVDLLADSDAAVANFAAARLARDPAGLAALDHCLESVAPAAERCAFGLAASPNAAEQVKHALGHLDPRVRQAMVHGLAGAQPPPPLAMLEPLKTDAAPEVRKALADLLGKLGQSARPMLSELVVDREPTVRSAAAAQLLQLLPADQLVSLAAQARHDEAIREAVLAGIGRLSEADAVRFLVSCLSATDSVERRQAIAALGRFRDADAMKALMDSAANDADPALRDLAVNVLAAQ